MSCAGETLAFFAAAVAAAIAAVVGWYRALRAERALIIETERHMEASWRAANAEVLVRAHARRERASSGLQDAQDQIVKEVSNAVGDTGDLVDFLNDPDRRGG